MAIYKVSDESALALPIGTPFTVEWEDGSAVECTRLQSSGQGEVWSVRGASFDMSDDQAIILRHDGKYSPRGTGVEFDYCDTFTEAAHKLLSA